MLICRKERNLNSWVLAWMCYNQIREWVCWATITKLTALTDLNPPPFPKTFPLSFPHHLESVWRAGGTFHCVHSCRSHDQLYNFSKLTRSCDNKNRSNHLAEPSLQKHFRDTCDHFHSLIWRDHRKYELIIKNERFIPATVTDFL